MVDKKSEPLEVKIFKKNIKFDLLQAVDGVINGLTHSAALGELSSKERAGLVIQAYQEEEKLVEKLKKRNGFLFTKNCSFEQFKANYYLPEILV
ncbi:MAG: hypothetical protein A3C71_02010 [Candidatus Yanofskybacteria bacterium RIFCSPHIGHO2_02_FULL_43_15c]|uniref:Uncharacterized protein n=2 Tax=Candidatus Yanofskyibacteriota TaxID=1752733 RepID=A0A1F8H770_9BACT|nr:MAG: hypothetical protein A3C71_02010 [Candidatus Yanofskybacteria bacterium RIFCSPHIGHO2_02_FULL_43_15c]OGN32759.1 MAG: hypothetical protein A3I92_01450 [Candidatus Yanofskybacteria bacterium RIFCSPLOWO2_02_FULL_43_10b]